MARRDPTLPSTSEGVALDQHVAAHNLTKNVAKIARDPATQRDYREACDETELGSRVAKALRMESYPKLDRR
ncbi:hypothetical protein [Nonomuraea salmonea]|uniref:Uncharacterized protein n=1 Tax=Nonomuraea salmonea TaxID=46181 RepID=A0ABV5P2Q0_9ACTN